MQTRDIPDAYVASVKKTKTTLQLDMECQDQSPTSPRDDSPSSMESSHHMFAQAATLWERCELSAEPETTARGSRPKPQEAPAPVQQTVPPAAEEAKARDKTSVWRDRMLEADRRNLLPFPRARGKRRTRGVRSSDVVPLPVPRPRKARTNIPEAKEDPQQEQIEDDLDVDEGPQDEASPLKASVRGKKP